MTIFPARRIGFLPPKRAQSARATATTIASTVASPAGYGLLTIGPDFAQPLARVEVEEGAGCSTERQHSALHARPANVGRTASDEAIKKTT
jgi:hypothetical protein